MKRASVLFENADDADRVVSTHRQKYLKIRDQNLILQYGSLTGLKPPCGVVFVGGLPVDTTEEDVRELIKRYPAPKEIRLCELSSLLPTSRPAEYFILSGKWLCTYSVPFGARCDSPYRGT
jgi:hypothetical protein